MNQSTRQGQLRARFTGGATATGKYEILFIQAAEGNGFTFTQQVLEESVPLWEGASVFVDHSYWAPQSVRDLGGVLSNVSWSDQLSGLTAHLTPAGPSKEIIREAAEVTMREGVTPNVGFSADIVFTADAAGNVTRILQPYSVDLVMDPAFATRFIRTLHQRRAAPSPQSPWIADRREAIRGDAASALSLRGLRKGASPQGGNQPERSTMQDEHLQAAQPDPVAETRTQLNQLTLDTALAVSDLPDKAKDAIRLGFKSAQTISVPDVQAAIQAWKDATAEASAPAEIQGPSRVSAMFNSDDQLNAAIDDLVGAPREPGAESLKVHRFAGLKEAYMHMTGDRDLVGGYFADRILFQHTAASFPALVANALNKALVRQWEQLGRAGYDWWTKIATVEHFESLNDIRWNMFGTVASLPTVAEGAEYTELTLGDNVETSSFVKKGGYIGLTLEAIDKDDTRKLRMIPRELAFAALREISALVAAIFTDNSGIGPTLADTGALFNNTAVTTAGGHANLLTTALGTDFTAWDAVAAAMYVQPMLVKNATSFYGTGKAMAIEPRYCLVPRELKAQAEALFIPRWGPVTGATVPAAGSSTYPGYVEPITVPEWTDATDWAAVADPAIMPGVMIGERFGLAPQIFLAGSEIDPAMFANDEQRIKVRHFIAVGVADFRPLHKSNVTGG